MTPERLAEIIADVITRRDRLRILHTAFREAVEADHKKAAAEEFKQFLAKEHGKRLPKQERDRIQREIAAEHRDRHREKAEEMYSHWRLAHRDEQPVLAAFDGEVQRPPTVEDEFTRRFPTDGRTVTAQFVMGLYEHIVTKDMGPTVANRKPSENLARLQALQNLNGGGTPQRIVLDSVEAREIEAHEGKWIFDPEDVGEVGADRALNAAIAAARGKRRPNELAETLAELRQAESFATTRQAALRLRLLSPKELEESIKRAEGEGDGGD